MQELPLLAAHFTLYCKQLLIGIRLVHMNTRVFLVDDHEVVRRGLASLISGTDDLEFAGEAGTVQDTLTRMTTANAKVVVLDVRLPDGDGIELCRELKANYSELQCLMLTSYSDDEALMAAILAGASGYILKQINGNSILDAIRRVAKGESLLDPTVTTKVLERLRKPPKQDELLMRLSPQERKILDLIAQGLTNREIAEKIFLAEKTVKNYVSNLLSKLNMGHRSEAAAYAARVSERNRYIRD